MKSCILILAVLLVVGCGASPSVVALPRPNSGKFTFAQAETRKPEIYSLSQSGMMAEWKNPYAGFCVHISETDEIIVYGSRLLFDRDGGRMTCDQLEALLNEFGDYVDSQPVGILITSARNPKRSRVFPVVLKLLFKPHIQVFYRKDT